MYIYELSYPKRNEKFGLSLEHTDQNEEAKAHMKILYYDCFSGISGDMNLGAMVDLGISPRHISDQLNLLNIKDEYTLTFENSRKMGISGTKAVVKLQHRNHTHPHPRRHLSDIEHIIKNSKIAEPVKQLSLQIFQRIAQAEARVHGTTTEQVHFHEVGATDAMVDIVGAAICFHQLDVDEVWSRPPELGSGFVHCTHGRMPVPAPATAELVRNIPTTSGAVQAETTTPTGAAILTTLAHRFTGRPSFTIKKTGYGLGHHDLEIPNVLRVYLAETDEKAPGPVMMECNIDDMNPEQYEIVMDKLFRAGADDVFLTHLIMKKGRPAVKISVLCHRENLDTMKDILFTETTTLGLRHYPVEKDMLKRTIREYNTPMGKVRVKEARYRDMLIRRKPEWEDCKKIAAGKNVPVQQVYLEIERWLNRE